MQIFRVIRIIKCIFSQYSRHKRKFVIDEKALLKRLPINFCEFGRILVRLNIKIKKSIQLKMHYLKQRIIILKNKFITPEEQYFS